MVNNYGYSFPDFLKSKNFSNLNPDVRAPIHRPYPYRAIVSGISPSKFQPEFSTDCGLRKISKNRFLTFLDRNLGIFSKNPENFPNFPVHTGWIMV